MESFLVMNNNLRRRFTKLSTYLVVLLVPVLILIIAAITTRIQTPVIRVGIIGEDSFYEEMAKQIAGTEQVVIRHANAKTLQTDLIVGTYSYVIEEGTTKEQQEEVIAKIASSIEKSNIDQSDLLAVTNETGIRQQKTTTQILSMVMTIFIVVSTVYTSSLIYDRKHGLQERFCYADTQKKAYAFGYLGSTATITGQQLVMVLMLCQLFDTGFHLSLSRGIPVFFFLLVITNGLGVLICSIVKSEMAANILASSAAVVLSMLGGTFITIEAMPKFMQTLSWISPMRWLIEMIG